MTLLLTSCLFSASGVGVRRWRTDENGGANITEREIQHKLFEKSSSSSNPFWEFINYFSERKAKSLSNEIPTSSASKYPSTAKDNDSLSNRQVVASVSNLYDRITESDIKCNFTDNWNNKRIKKLLSNNETDIHSGDGSHAVSQFCTGKYFVRYIKLNIDFIV